MEKEKEALKLQVLRITPWIFLLLLPLFYLHLFWGTNIQLDQRLHYSSRKVMQFNTSLEEENQESLDFLLSRLMKGEEVKKLKETGFACTTQKHYSKHCVANQPLQIDTKTMTLTTIALNPTVDDETIIRPYARQEDHTLLQTITPVKVLRTTSPPLCQHNHQNPAVIFSSGGFTGNVFHEFNEIIIPLYITTSLFKSRVQFILMDYKPSFVRKYAKLLARLTSHEIINPDVNRGAVHCFPAAVIGLNFHYHLSLNNSKAPTGLSMNNFKQFLRNSFNLKFSHVAQIKRPTVMLLSRTTTRRILNEDEVVTMMKSLGFRVMVVRRAKVIANLDVFSGMVNACSVLVGAHGAGLTNEVFLPDGAVMVQLDLIGLEWAARTYYGDPARAMGVKYLRYKIEAEESSLFKVFGSRNHTAIVDPGGAFSLQAGKEVYLNGQNVIVNVTRFRETMVEAMSLVRDSPLL